MNIQDFYDSRLVNCTNPYQGKQKKVLVVCSAGLLRSPTVAWILSNAPWNYNTRAAGSNKEYALIPIDNVLIKWADQIVFVNAENYHVVKKNFPELNDKSVVVLDVPDKYPFRDPELVRIATEQLHEAGI